MKPKFNQIQNFKSFEKDHEIVKGNNGKIKIWSKIASGFIAQFDTCNDFVSDLDDGTYKTKLINKCKRARSETEFMESLENKQ